MKESKSFDRIEIRSEKVRKIIGIVPHKIIYFGYSLFFVIFITLLTFGILFKSSYHIKTTIEITSDNGNKIGLLKIPAFEFSKIDIDDKVIVSFLNYNNTTITSKVDSLSKEVQITNNSMHYFGYIKMQDSLITDSGFLIQHNDTLLGSATIITKPFSLFHRIASSYKY